jgi:glycosyltransferase involved in cell wall biosynthesis
MTVPPFISVVITTRNRAHMLTEALGSLLEQDYPTERYEIVVVDDGSTDETPGVVEKLAAGRRQPRMRLVRQSPKNQNAARNRGISEATGDLIAFLDDDELAPKEWLSSLVQGAGRHPDAGCLGGPARLQFEGRPPRLCEWCGPGEGSFDMGVGEQDVDEVGGGNMLLRTWAVDGPGLFDETLEGHGDETEWMVRFRRMGGRIVYLPQVAVWHRRGRTDLHLTNRLRKGYAIGRQTARNERVAGQHVSSRHWPTWPRSHVSSLAHLAAIPRLLGHAAKRGCSGGLTKAARALGYAMGGRWRPVHR